VTRDQRGIHRKKRILEYAERIGKSFPRISSPIPTVADAGGTTSSAWRLSAREIERRLDHALRIGSRAPVGKPKPDGPHLRVKTRVDRRGKVRLATRPGTGGGIRIRGQHSVRPDSTGSRCSHIFTVSSRK